MDDKGSYTYTEYEYVLLFDIFDISLVGYEILVTAKYSDPTDTLLAGPVVDKVVVEEAPQPVPKLRMLAIASLSSYLVNGI